MNWKHWGVRYCLAIKKDKTLCKNSCMRIYLKNGYWITPLTCFTHKGQVKDNKEKDILIN